MLASTFRTVAQALQTLFTALAVSSETRSWHFTHTHRCGHRRSKHISCTGRLHGEESLKEVVLKLFRCRISYGIHLLLL